MEMVKRAMLARGLERGKGNGWSRRSGQRNCPDRNIRNIIEIFIIEIIEIFHYTFVQTHKINVHQE